MNALALLLLLSQLPASPSPCRPGADCKVRSVQTTCVATASLGTCNAAALGRVRCDATTSSLKFCNGSAWGALGGGITEPLTLTQVLSSSVAASAPAIKLTESQRISHSSGSPYLTFANNYLHVQGNFSVGSNMLISYVNAYGGYPLELNGNANNGASAKAVRVNSNQSLTTTGAKIATFENATVEKAYVDKDGSFFSAGSAYGVTSNNPLHLKGNSLDIASGVGVKLMNDRTMLTAGAVIAGFYSDNAAATRAASIDIYGGLRLNEANLALQTCSATFRGRMMFVQGGTGVADGVFVCMKNNTDTYSWIELLPG